MGEPRMIADIASGEVDTADVAFLIALILFVVAVVASFVTSVSRFYNAAVAAGLAFLALALLVL